MDDNPGDIRSSKVHLMQLKAKNVKVDYYRRQ